MPRYPESLERMLTAWNETDSSKVLGHLEAALESDIEFIDPNYVIHGIDDFEAMVHAVHQKIPGAVYSHVGAVDAHHNLYRYHWAIHVNGQLIMPGFDVTELSENGLVSRVLGFLDL